MLGVLRYESFRGQLRLPRVTFRRLNLQKRCNLFHILRSSECWEDYSMRLSNTRVLLSAGFALVILCRSTGARPQSSSAVTVHPDFETVSVKPGNPTGRWSLGVAPGGRFTATDATLQQLL